MLWTECFTNSYFTLICILGYEKSNRQLERVDRLYHKAFPFQVLVIKFTGRISSNSSTSKYTPALYVGRNAFNKMPTYCERFPHRKSYLIYGG